MEGEEGVGWVGREALEEGVWEPEYGVLARDVVGVGRVAYHARSVDGAKSERSRKVTFHSTVRRFVLSKFVRFWRSMISSIRGCCHLPGVDTAGEGCCGVGVLVAGVLYLDCDWGV